jgi:stress response protein YsnF
LDRDGAKAGSIVDLYIGERTEQPTWALVRTGLLGSRETLVPLDQATVPLAAVISGAGSVQVPFANATILDAPSVAVGEGISEAAAAALRRYYRLGEPAAPAEDDDGLSDTEPLDAGPAVPAATTTTPMTTASTEPSGTMVRSEEELRVRMLRRARRVRVKRYVVTDYVTRSIPVRREELRLEAGELVDEANLTAPPAPPGDGREMVLHQEEVVVSKRVVARERVRLRVQTVTEHRRISGEVRIERIEVDKSSMGD